MRYSGEGNVGGQLESVTGSLFRDDEEVSTYRAEKAIADEETGELTLQGSVEVYSIEHKSTLRSDELIWASKGREIVKAKGNVTLESPLYSAGPMPEMWAAPDLSRVATPDKFEQSIDEEADR